MDSNENIGRLEKAKSFAAGLVVGGAIGAGAALLNAPRSGKTTRRQLRRKASEVQQQAGEKVDEVRERVQKTSDAVSERAEEVRQRAQKAAEEASQRADEIKAQASTTRRETEGELARKAEEIEQVANA